MKLFNFLVCLSVGFIAVIFSSMVGLVTMFKVNKAVASVLGILVILTSCVSNSSTAKAVTSSVDTTIVSTQTDTITRTKVLVFEGYVNTPITYKLEVNDGDVRLSYQFGNYEPIVEFGRFEYINGDYKIIINGCDDCYDLVSTSCDGCKPFWHLCVYNPEIDRDECFQFNEDKSNCLVNDLFQ